MPARPGRANLTEPGGQQTNLINDSSGTVENSLKKRPRIFYGWVILGVAIITIILGYTVRNTFSVFYPAVVEAFGWERGSTALMFSITILFYGLAAPAAGGLADRFGPRLVLPMGACIMGGGLILCSLARTQWHFYLFYGVIAAVGLSIAGWTPLTTMISNWFVKKRGLAFGILAAAFGASLPSAYAAQFLISRFGWQTAYVIIGLASIIIIVPLCAFFLRRSPQEKGLMPDGIPQTQHKAQAQDQPAGQTIRQRQWADTTWTLSGALRTYQFWLLFLISFCLMGFAEQTLVAHQVYFFKDAGYEPMTAAAIYSVFGIMYAIGKLCSFLSDHLGREMVFIPGCLLSTALAGLLFFIEDMHQPWMPFLFAACFGLAFGPTIPILLTTVADLFQGRHFGSIQGVVMVGLSLGGAISPWLAGFLHDKTGSYSMTFFLLVVSLLVPAVLMWLVAPRKVRPVPGQRRRGLMG